MNEKANNPWFYTVYKGESMPIPFRVWGAPTAPADITGYSFSLRAKIAMEEGAPKFELDNSHFTIENASTGLASFKIPDSILAAAEPGDYLSQITVSWGEVTRKTKVFTIRILDSI